MPNTLRAQRESMSAKDAPRMNKAYLALYNKIVLSLHGVFDRKVLDNGERLANEDDE